MTTAHVLAPLAAARASDDTATPIKHVIVIVGENRTFDHIFATYRSKSGVNNLLSEGIVTANGNPGPRFGLGIQKSASVLKEYSIAPRDSADYDVLPTPLTGGAPSVASDTNPPPYATIAAVAKDQQTLHSGLSVDDYQFLITGATGLPPKSPDVRIDDVTKLPSGPFQITDPMSYDSYAASPVHRFYQMWQQLDCSRSHAWTGNPAGCLNDLFAWVEVSVGAGSNGKSQPPNFNDATTGEGSTAMGFYNMAKGDAQYTKWLADQYTISDNYHQPIMGGTGANSIILGTGFPIYWSDASGNPTMPPQDYIENPNPQSGTNNYYIQDGYGASDGSGGGSLTNCSDPQQPGVQPILKYLSSIASHPDPKCAANTYYLLNNYNPG